MNFKINKTLLIWGSVVATVVISISIVWSTFTSSSFRCPNEYGTAEQYITGVTEWASGQLAGSPNMTKEELLSERQRLFKEHHCESSRWPTLPNGL